MSETPKAAARRLSARARREGYQPEALHAYTNADGEPQFWRIRLKNPATGEKWIRPMHENGAGFELGEPKFGAAGKPLYALDRITAADLATPIYIVEGEKAADALLALGAVATTSGGAESADRADWTPLRDRTCILWPDRDDPGREYAGNVATILQGLNCNLQTVDIDALDLPPKGDARDWAQANPDATIDDVHALPTIHAKSEGADATKTGGPKPTAPPLRFVWADAVEQPSAADELIEGLISRASRNILFGPSGCGKTFAVIELATSSSIGRTFLGRHVRKCPVAYFACEAGRSVGNRFIARRRDLGIDELPVAIITSALDLRSPMSVDTDAVIATIRTIDAKIAIIDTFNAAFAGGEENSSQDMGLFLANMTRIVEATGVALVVVHHVGKETNRGLRGHTSLYGAADTVLEVTNAEGLVTIKVVKHRDAPTGGEMLARLRVVDLGYEDSWGNKMTSCVVDPIDQLQSTPKPKPAKLPTGTDIPFRALREAIADLGETMPGTSAIPAGVKSITGEAWRRRYYTLDALDVADTDSKAHAKAVEARGKRFTRARVALQSANLIGACNDRYWVYP